MPTGQSLPDPLPYLHAEAMGDVELFDAGQHGGADITDNHIIPIDWITICRDNHLL
jgi:hypothetical protein